jgi:hypothetical protein
MSKESLGLPIVLATVCAAGAVALGFAANNRFEQGSELDAARDCIETVIEQQPNPDICTPEPTDATPEELAAVENNMQGQEYAANFFGGVFTLGALTLGGCTVANGRTAVNVFIRRRRDDGTDPQAV